MAYAEIVLNMNMVSINGFSKKRKMFLIYFNKNQNKNFITLRSVLMVCLKSTKLEYQTNQIFFALCVGKPHGYICV